MRLGTQNCAARDQALWLGVNLVEPVGGDRLSMPGANCAQTRRRYYPLLSALHIAVDGE